MIYIVLTIAFMCNLDWCWALDAPNVNSTQTKAHILPPCQACKALVNSFKAVSLFSYIFYHDVYDYIVKNKFNQFVIQMLYLL